MLVSELYILFSIFVVGVLTSPVQDAAGASCRGGRSMKISRRSSRQIPTHANSIGVFDMAFAEQELRDILTKYEHASQFFQGIGLAPDENLTSYYGIVNSESFNTSYNPASIFDVSSGGRPLIPPVIVAAGTGMGVAPLKDFISGTLDILYYGPLEFGTPPQQLTVDIDTGSADLWVPADCTGCENNQFKPKMSSTYKNQGTRFSVSYGAGEVSGTRATDVVSMAGLRVEEQAFGVVKHVSDDFNGYPNDGLIGMAFSSIAQSRQPTFFENLIRTKKVTAPLFSVHLSRGQETSSEVCFGCYDATKVVGSVSWIPVKSKTYWTVPMDGLVVNSAAILSTDLIAAIDTGTTLIYVPDDVAANFYSMIADAQSAPQFGPAFYTYPCASTLDMALSFAGQRFSLDPSDFNLGRTEAGSPDCVGGILSMGDGFPSNLAIIGDEFLKSWYSTFDYDNGPRVGFSPSINNKN